MFSSALFHLFVCLQDYGGKKLFAEFDGKVARAKPLDFGGNPDHVMLGLG